MICDECKLKLTCESYQTYMKLKDSAYLGLGKEASMGDMVLKTLEDYPLDKCEHFVKE